MTIERMLAAYNQQPFKPFVIHLADGRAIPVISREFILAVPSGRTVIVCQPDESFSIIDVLLVTDLEFKDQATGNGHGKRRRSR